MSLLYEAIIVTARFLCPNVITERPVPLSSMKMISVNSHKVKSSEQCVGKSVDNEITTKMDSHPVQSWN